MTTKNYAQFSKKQLLFGLDKHYAFAFFMLFASIGMISVFVNTNVIYTVTVATLTFMVSVVFFKKDPYWFRKNLMHKAINNKYKSLNDICPR